MQASQTPTAGPFGEQWAFAQEIVSTLFEDQGATEAWVPRNSPQWTCHCRDGPKTDFQKIDPKRAATKRRKGKQARKMRKTRKTAALGACMQMAYPFPCRTSHSFCPCLWTRGLRSIHTAAKVRF